jgi:DNA-binding Lrp family transcriptional regulator
MWRFKMPEKFNTAAAILQMVMKSKDPVKDLLAEAATFLDKGDIKSLQHIDSMLDGTLIELVRNDLMDELSSFAYRIVIFLSGARGVKLKFTTAGQKLFDRWEHLRDLCGFALKDRDAQFTSRFIRSRKHGEHLAELLHKKREGMRAVELANHLNMSEQQLSKILREFEAEDVIVREKTKGGTFVRLGFMGRVYMVKKTAEASAGNLLKVNPQVLPKNPNILFFDQFSGTGKDAPLGKNTLKKLISEYGATIPNPPSDERLVTPQIPSEKVVQNVACSVPH